MVVGPKPQSQPKMRQIATALDRVGVKSHGLSHTHSCQNDEHDWEDSDDQLKPCERSCESKPLILTSNCHLKQICRTQS